MSWLLRQGEDAISCNKKSKAEKTREDPRKDREHKMDLTTSHTDVIATHGKAYFEGCRAPMPARRDTLIVAHASGM